MFVPDPSCFSCQANCIDNRMTASGPASPVQYSSKAEAKLGYLARFAPGKASVFCLKISFANAFPTNLHYPNLSPVAYCSTLLSPTFVPYLNKDSVRAYYPLSCLEHIHLLTFSQHWNSSAP